MVEAISKLFADNHVLATIIMSMFPMIELKGAIVFASAEFSVLQSFALAFIGSSFVCIPIFFLLKPVLNLLKKIKWVNSFILKIENYFQEKADEALKRRLENEKKPRKDSYLKKMAVFIFVAIPLPLTGVWAGTAIAVFLNLKFKETVLPLLIGNFIAGLLISGLTKLCLTFWSITVLDYILYILLGIAVVLMIFTIIKLVRSKPKKEKTEE